MKKILHLFLIMFKIGLFTFGGGYAMIPLIENEFVSKRDWMNHDEFMDMLAIAESSPGPIAINMATYIGYKQGKFIGSLFATLGVILPSFIIICLISLFIKQFLEIAIISAIFKGIQIGVIFLILMAGLKLFKKLEKSVFNYIVFFVTIICFLFFSLFAIQFSAIYYILIAGILSLFICLINNRGKQKGEKQ